MTRNPNSVQFTTHMWVWSYQISHRKLIFRSSREQGQSTVTEVVFDNVIGMKTRSSYGHLSINEVDASAEMDDLVEVPERLQHRFRRLALFDDGRPAGFVYCGSFYVHEAPADR